MEGWVDMEFGFARYDCGWTSQCHYEGTVRRYGGVYMKFLWRSPWVPIRAKPAGDHTTTSMSGRTICVPNHYALQVIIAAHFKLESEGGRNLAPMMGDPSPPLHPLSLAQRQQSSVSALQPSILQHNRHKANQN